MKLFQGVAAINKEIDSIKKAGAKLDARIHVAGVSAIAHVAEHGDIGPINRLYLALPKGARKSAMAAWLMKFAPVVPNDAANAKDAPWAFKRGKDANVAQAIETPWYDFKPEPEVVEMFDLTKGLAAFLKRAMAANSVDDPKLLAKLKDLAQATGLGSGKKADDEKRKGAGAVKSADDVLANA